MRGRVYVPPKPQRRAGYMLDSGDLEMNAALIRGAASIESDEIREDMQKLDSFYIPGKTQMKILALSDSA